MVQLEPALRLFRLPAARELPDSDDTPVDDELQKAVPRLLKDSLCLIWQNRSDWFMGVTMGIYADIEQPYRAVVPDSFLSLNVPRFRDKYGNRGRPSYIFWEEDGIMPILALEVVSATYRGEYEAKSREYRDMDILYYVVYDPKGDRSAHVRLEVYRLVGGEYVLMSGEPVWMPEVGLGIGRAMGRHWLWEREWLYWFSREGERYPVSEEYQRYRADRAENASLQAEQQAEQERQARLQAEQQAQCLAERLRALGIDPDTAPGEV